MVSSNIFSMKSMFKKIAGGQNRNIDDNQALKKQQVKIKKQKQLLAKKMKMIKD
jgi:hypothetical protein